jgi:streptogramin lyase/DNA-directed RNA polymerase subunit RPC12/RpoP
MAASATSSNPQLFHCPTCGAALPVPDEAPSVRCQYCGSTVLVPPEYRSQKSQPVAAAAQPIVIHVDGQAIDVEQEAPQARRSIVGVITILTVSCVLISAISVVLIASGVFSTTRLVSQSIHQVITQAVVVDPAAQLTQAAEIAPTTMPTINPGYSITLQFGARGSGPGQFDDARWVAVAPDGNLFTAEFQDGRLQKFDPTGKFLSLINIPPDDQEYITVSDLVADYAGRLLVARRGHILIFDAASGSQSDAIPRSFPDTWYEALAVDPANNIYALHVAAGELDLIKMDSNGQMIYRLPQITEGLVKKTEISQVRRLAVDGLGNIYLLDESQNQVYLFDPQGGFVDRFGSKGDGPGLLDRPEDLAVDGQQRIYILDQDGIEIFDATGVSLKHIPSEYEGHAFDIKVDLEGSIYIITNAGKVYKLKVSFNT